MDCLGSQHFDLVFFRLDKFDTSDNTADSEEKDKAGDGETHGCMHIVFHKHELEIANETVDKGCDEDDGAADPMEPHV